MKPSVKRVGLGLVGERSDCFGPTATMQMETADGNNILDVGISKQRNPMLASENTIDQARSSAAQRLAHRRRSSNRTLLTEERHMF